MTAEPLELEAPSRYNTTRIGNWLRLVRLPNLLTVPGDPIVGFLLAAPYASWSLHHVWAAIAVALCAYAGGVALNDVMDISRDRNRQPWRPLPFGLISLQHAEGAVFVLLAAGVLVSVVNGLDSAIIGVCLLLAIVAYNVEIKEVPLLGAVGMGFCRALSVWLGVFAAPGDPQMNAAAWLGAGAVSAYVIGLSLYAKFERRESAPMWAVAAPLAATLLSAGLALGVCGPMRGLRFVMVVVLLGALLAFPLLLLVRRCRNGMELPNGPLRVASVGVLLRGLLILQAALVAASGGGALAVVLIVLLLGAWPLHAHLERTFYAS